ncbi:ArsR/SmtB family transcription factor [Archaeoglobus neptunius]|uniref:ArsR/SmtB family transcription factor n=1 Tax=Archaeoglobus neptunius TaxID=2798580 RepID=UPI0019254E3E|nr:ArsR family transcriptional regulator [Archaeoglobus neptunius]
MVSEAESVLEILGNESRRRILELLSKKPCYVSEISYYLGMAPKVVIEHLEKLEKSGIVASFEEGRRRYYYIPKSIRLEVVISPHKFEATIRDGEDYDIPSLMREIRNEFNMIEKLRTESISEIYRALRVAEDLQNRFSRVQSVLAARFNQIVERMLNEVERVLSDDLERLVMLGLAKGLRSAAEIAECFRLPYREVERALISLSKKGLVKQEERNGELIWIIK